MRLWPRTSPRVDPRSAERALAVLRAHLGHAPVRLRVREVCTVWRATARERLEASDLDRPGRQAREEELWSCPEHLLAFVRHEALPEAVAPEGYRGTEAAAALPAALRRRLQAAVDEWANDSGVDAVRYDLSMCREEVAVCVRRRPWLRIILGLRSGRVFDERGKAPHTALPAEQMALFLERTPEGDSFPCGAPRRGLHMCLDCAVIAAQGMALLATRRAFARAANRVRGA